MFRSSTATISHSTSSVSTYSSPVLSLWSFICQRRILLFSSFIIVMMCIFSAFSHGNGAFAVALQDQVSSYFSWLYSSSMNCYLLVCLFLVMSPFGKIRLGSSNNERPEFSTFSWLAMLFSAGMGIGLFFYGVVEPLSHYLFSFSESGPQSQSLALTIFHWGIHPWACYAIVGLCFAYFAYRKGKTFALSSCLSPLIGKNSRGILGSLVNAFAVICPVIGIAISLGIGALQISKGLEYSLSLSGTFFVQVVIILSITLLSTLSVISGVTKGMKYLSIINIGLSFLLLCFIFFSGGALLGTLRIVSDLGAYVRHLPFLSLWSGSHDYRAGGNIFNWTTFYWSTWIAWAPFVGMFIARISKGRTIREYLLGAIVVPTILSAIWFSILGNSAIDSLNETPSGLRQIITTDTATTFFAFLSQYSEGILLYGLAILCLKLFFITSADSATLVIATAANEKGKPSTYEKIYWSIGICAVAITFLATGGLETMQIVAIISSVPFAVISWLMIVSLFKELAAERSS